MKKLILILLISQAAFAQTPFSQDLNRKQIVALIDSLNQSYPVQIDSSSFATGGKEINFMFGQTTVIFDKLSTDQFYFRRFYGSFERLFPVWQKLFDPKSKPEAITSAGAWKLINKSRAQFRKASSGDWYIDIRN